MFQYQRHFLMSTQTLVQISFGQTAGFDSMTPRMEVQWAVRLVIYMSQCMLIGLEKDPKVFGFNLGKNHDIIINTIVIHEHAQIKLLI